MSKFNPDLLLKDELVYEALMRGLPYTDITVSELRHSLREKQHQLSPKSERLQCLELGDEVELCYAKFRELSSLARNAEEEKSPAVILRIQQRIEHLIRRVNNLVIWPGITVTARDVQKFADEALQQLPSLIKALRRRSDTFKIDEIESSLLSLNLSPLQSPTTEQRATTVTFQLPIDTGAEENINQIVSDPVGTTPYSVPPVQNVTVSDPCNVNVNVLGSPVVHQPNICNSLSLHPFNRMESSFCSNWYGKITNPVEKILSEIQPTDGLNISRLMEFLKSVLRIYELQQLSDTQVLEIIMPRSRSPLKDRILEAIRSKSSFEQFHAMVINYFIPTGIYEELKRNTVLRVQGTHERLAHFVAEVREYARLLKTNFSEAQLVENILVGLSPEERSRLVLLNRPNSFAELERCCIHSSNVWYSDQNRRIAITRAATRCELPPVASEPVDLSSRNKRYFHRSPRWTNKCSAPVEVSNPGIKPKRCYNCGKAGHFSRECKQKRFSPKLQYPKNV